jgi:hypothetical protein
VSHYTYENENDRDADREVETGGIGISFWRIKNINDSVYAQIGMQIGYETTSNEGGYVYESMGGVSGGVSGSVYTEELDGFVVAPGVGLFYTFTENLHVGLEMKCKYAQLEGEREGRSAGYPEYTWTDDPIENIEETRAHTHTQAVMKLYF